MKPPQTIREWIQWGTHELKDTSDAPRLDAAWILLHILKQDTQDFLVTHADDTIDGTRFQELIQRRKTGMPLAYIFGQWHFYGRPFVVTQDTLIPRPATEDLVDQAKQYILDQSRKYRKPLVIADIGTGSGCIAITLALELPVSYLSHIYATDISSKALAVARTNAQTYGVTDRITFLEGNMLEPLQDKNIDLLVSNPPYIPSHELRQASTSPETHGLQYEPPIALDGGLDGKQYISLFEASTLPVIYEGEGGRIYRFRC